MSSNLTFINASSIPRNGDQSNSKMVRSHVMKKYRQQRKAEVRSKVPLGRYKVPFYDSGVFTRPTEAQRRTAKSQSPKEEASPSLEVSPKTAGLIDSEEIDDVEEIERPEKSSRSPESLDITSLSFLDVGLNAYNFLPIQASQRVLMLLQTNIKSTIRTSVHADPSEKYLSYYVDNAARLYIALSYAATRFQDQSGDGSSESVYYLMKSISAVNDDIADPQKQASDSTIATVASMANIENLNGNPENALIHLNGLKRMVELRGGIHCLGMRGILQRVVLWADLCSASRSQTLPRFSLVQFPDMPPLQQFSPPSRSKSYSLALKHTLLSRAITTEHAGVIHTLLSLHELSTFLNLVGTESEDLPVEACYPDRVYIVEHNILTSLYLSESSGQDQQSDIWDILRHASLLFIYTNLRQTPVGGQIRRSLSNRLRLCMQNAALGVFRSDLPAEILWVSCIGLGGSQHTSDYQWFLDCAERICIEYLIGSWEEVLEFCGSMPALERSCARKCETLWAKNIFS